MRNLISELRDKTKSQSKNLGHPLWCTINGVLTPVVYQERDFDGFNYYKEVFLTNSKKIRARESLKHVTNSNAPIQEVVTTTTTTPQGTITTTELVKISPVAVFNFDFGVIEDSDKVSKWNSSLGGYLLERSTADKRPIFGESGEGEPLSSSINFKFAGDSSFNNFMSLNNSITLSGDFTIICTLKIFKLFDIFKKCRILGNSSDSDMFISAAESSVGSDISSYEFSLSSSANGSLVVPNTGIFEPTNPITVLTIRRSKDRLVIRENSKQLTEGTILTDDVTFDQVGRLGTDDNATLNGVIFNISIYSGAIVSELENLEDEMLKIASHATE